MLSYGTYIGILFPTLMVIPTIFGLILVAIPVTRLTEIVKMVLGIEEIPQADSDTITINFHGTRMKMNKLADRCKLIMTLLMIFAIVNILFFNGCIISIDYLIPGQLCSDKPKDCFIFESRTSRSPSNSFPCNPGEAVIPVNSSAFLAVCYRYILGDQKAVDILNQLGICTGVISLSANMLWLLCWIVSHKWSWFILRLIIIAISLVIIVLFFIRGPVDPITFVLYVLWVILVGMALWIVLGNTPRRLFF